MPVWHERTRAMREAGELVVVGITQEQHPDRCRLFAQWQGIDWPILWDPFNLTRSAAVPMAMGVDERGVLVAGALNPRRYEEQFEDEFMSAEPATGAVEGPTPYPGLGLEGAKRKSLAGDDIVLVPEQAMSRLLFYEHVHGAPLPGSEFDHAVKSLALAAASPGAAPEEHFRHGVALRLRYDSPHHRPTDFQESLDAWTAALLANPAQYIWRRRIQQWGPRLDKPYPFYDWVERARAELVERGATPVPVRVPLTGSEIADKTNEIPEREVDPVHPDPGRKVPRDESGLVAIETAAALHTGIASQRVREPAGTSRVHVVLRPDTEREVHWSNDAGATQVWIAVPEGWNVRRNLHTLDVPGGEESSSEVRRLDFEVRPPLGPPTQASLRGTAYYYVCEGASGTCLFLAQDFEIPIPLPASGGEGADGGR